MAIIPKNLWPAQTLDNDANYPQGKARDVTVPGDNTGTPWVANLVNDLWGFCQALLAEAGITPSGTPDQVGASQYLDALNARFTTQAEVDTRLGTTGNLKVLPYEIATAINARDPLSVAGVTTSPNAFAFGDSGTKLYVCDNATVYQFSLTTAYDVATATYDSLSGSLTEDTINEGIQLSSDGTKLFALGTNGDNVDQYTLSTPWNISTISADSVALALGTQDTATRGFFISEDGTRVFMCGLNSDSVHRYTLTVAWDLSSGSFDVGQSFSVASQVSGASDVWLSANGRRMFVLDRTVSDAIYEYELTTPYDLTTAAYANISLIIPDAVETESQGIVFNPFGSRLYVIGSTSDAIHQFFCAPAVAA